MFMQLCNGPKVFRRLKGPRLRICQGLSFWPTANLRRVHMEFWTDQGSDKKVTKKSRFLHNISLLYHNVRMMHIYHELKTAYLLRRPISLITVNPPRRIDPGNRHLLTILVAINPSGTIHARDRHFLAIKRRRSPHPVFPPLQFHPPKCTCSLPTSSCPSRLKFRTSKRVCRRVWKPYVEQLRWMRPED